MNYSEIMKERHSVRSYIDKPIEQEKVDALNKMIDEINAESGLNIRLFTNEPGAFGPGFAHYGAIKGCKNYFALAGAENADEKIGYYGEKLVLYAQKIGLNTCWIALTYNKGKVNMPLNKGEKLHVVISLGYGENNGTPHRSKKLSELAEINDDTPDWFIKGMEAAQLAPTAINQQKFYFKIKDNKVSAKSHITFYGKMDIGIAKYHFELGAGKENFEWE